MQINSAIKIINRKSTCLKDTHKLLILPLNFYTLNSKMKHKVSLEVEAQAMKIAKGTQKMGQTKEQTKLIAQGIEKGVAEYKKQQGRKLREIDKQRKQKIKQRDDESTETVKEASNNSMKPLPWILLAISWLGFVAYIVL
jgi:hypothetical protein